MTCRLAASDGYLDVLKYTHENGCPWDEETCVQAAKRGDLDMLKYAHENGCPWNARAWLNSTKSIREYLEENHCPKYYYNGSEFRPFGFRIVYSKDEFRVV